MQKDQMNFPSKQRQIEIKTVTWAKDSHGLFDYESSQVTIKKLTTYANCYIYRKDGDTLFQESPIEQQSSSQDNNDQNILAKITNEQNQFQINSSEQHNHQPFIIVRSLKNKEGQQKGYEIIPGDIVKLGRVEFRVVECKYNNDFKSVEESSKNIMNINPNYLDEYRRQNKPIQCRICLNDQESLEDDMVFINPCKCSGTCEFMHVGCLKQWLANKISPKISGCATYFKTKYLECEVCKFPLPRTIKIGEQIFDIVDIKKPKEGPYIMMETLSKDKNLPQGLYIVEINTIQNEAIKLGRGHASDIRISDISVSRLHAFIKYENNKFVLTDNNSKFGTLVQIRNTYEINYEKMAIQVGRTVITFALRSQQELAALKLQTNQSQENVQLSLLKKQQTSTSDNQNLKNLDDKFSLMKSTK